MAGFSIPAMEHSTVTSWGRDHETDAFRNMLRQYAKPNALVACVSDSYDIFEACERWGTELKQQVLDSGAIVVIRPDSGNPSEIVVKCLQILDKHFGHTVNEKGFRVLNNVRVIQGDGIDHTNINSILFCMKLAFYSADNVAFGQGGALLQQVNRDTQMFAMKCSAAKVQGEWVDVYKQPATDSKKDSKKGRLMLLEHNNSYATVRWEEGLKGVDALTVRFENGEIKNKTTFDEIRARANKQGG